MKGLCLNILSCTVLHSVSLRFIQLHFVFRVYTIKAGWSEANSKGRAEHYRNITVLEIHADKVIDNRYPLPKTEQRNRVHPIFNRSILNVLRFPLWPCSGALRTQKLKSQLVRTQELKRSPFKAWSRSVYCHTRYTYCQGFIPCLFLPFWFIHLHFFPKPLPIFPVLAVANTWFRRIK